jgi:hypothetical protein
MIIARDNKLLLSKMIAMLRHEKGIKGIFPEDNTPSVSRSLNIDSRVRELNRVKFENEVCRI